MLPPLFDGWKEREELTPRLMKYCELVTLAMVMIYDHCREGVWGSILD